MAAACTCWVVRRHPRAARSAVILRRGPLRPRGCCCARGTVRVAHRVSSLRRCRSAVEHNFRVRTIAFHICARRPPAGNLDACARHPRARRRIGCGMRCVGEDCRCPPGRRADPGGARTSDGESLDRRDQSRRSPISAPTRNGPTTARSRDRLRSSPSASASCPCDDFPPGAGLDRPRTATARELAYARAPAHRLRAQTRKLMTIRVRSPPPTNQPADGPQKPACRESDGTGLPCVPLRLR